MRRWMVGWCVAMLATPVWDAALACQQCAADLSCAMSSGGGVMCLADGGACFLAGRCGSVHFVPQGTTSIQLTLLEDSPALGGGGPWRVVREAGEIAVGREAVRIAGGPAWPSGPGDGVLYSGCGTMEGGIAVFRSPRGDGFTLERDNFGRGAILTVHELAGERPGRLIAHERVGERDVLVARVPFGGRTCVLVLQAAALPASEGQARNEAALRELRAAAAGRVSSDRPPFELKVLDR